MKFNVGEVVFYADYGVCLIENIVLRSSLISNRQEEYYQLKPIQHPKSKIFLPIKNEALVGQITKLPTLKEINSIIEESTSREIAWIENKAERQLQFRTIMEDRNRLKLIGLIKNLHAQQQKVSAEKKKLTSTDNEVFRKAVSIISEEFAYVLKIKIEEVMPLVLGFQI